MGKMDTGKSGKMHGCKLRKEFITASDASLDGA
jgi:hypothetical protein